MTDVMKEFLVSIGFESDGVDKFNDQLIGVQAKAVALGEAMYDLAKTAAQAVADMATGLDSLYWQTQRLGSSATDIKAYGYAMEQMGGSARGAQSSLEGIAEFAKSSPGAKSWLVGALGVSPKDIGNAEAMARDLARTFEHMPYYRAKAYGGMLGIDPIQLQAMLRGGGDQYEAQYKAMAARIGGIFGVNLDQSSKEGKEFMNNLRELRAEFELFFMGLESKALEYLVPKMEQLAHWIDDIASGKKLDGIGGNLAAIALDIKDLSKALSDLMSSGFMNEFGVNLTGSLDHALRLLTNITKIINDVLSGNWKAAWIDAQAAGLNAEQLNPAAMMGAGIGGAIKGEAPSFMHRVAARVVGLTPEGAQNAKTAFSFFKSQGYSDEQAKGVTAMLFSESGLNPRSVNPKSGAAGIAQWLTKGRVAEFESKFHKRITDASLMEQLQFVAYEFQHRYKSAWKSMLRHNDARSIMENGIWNYESPGNLGAIGDAARGYGFLAANPFQATLGAKPGNSQTLHQTTNINVHGSGDPHQAAQAVAGAQGDVNQRLASNFSVTVK